MIPPLHALQASTSEPALSRDLPWRVLLAVALLGLGLTNTALGGLVRDVFIDAFTAVASFVGLTLLLFYGAERMFGVDLGHTLATARRWQVPLAALLGATPGCGGAVVVVAAYTAGQVSFGAVVAALTATMGDAAFLLIASRPDAALVVLPTALVVGVLWGWTLDALNVRVKAGRVAQAELPRLDSTRWTHIAYALLLLAGVVIGVGDLVGLSAPRTITLPFAMLGTAAGLFLWATSPVRAMTHPSDPPVARAAEETAFITTWVLGAFLAYELAVFGLGVDLEHWFAARAMWVPLIAILVGFIPGCGPQIVVTTLYLNGIVPFAALLGNAIANDGDALFPALALDRRAAISATFYSAVPAVIVAYTAWLAGVQL